MTANDRTDLGLTDSAAACSCCATASTPAAAEVPTPATVTEEVLVSGMTCSHCVMSVTEELTGIDGVHNVSVDLNAGGASRVTIRSATPIHAEAVQAAVEDAGYTLVSSPA
ncbi:heavy-metal-associated domain-containing protein [Microbacterium sp. A1-JK]|uniref:heavy-metal-associated domain-containing protein n=1 Tax=Microbacterium sp. A1-JK TaxID=3177516 RepID=UPI003889911A